jgi:hypothetical protein
MDMPGRGGTTVVTALSAFSVRCTPAMVCWKTGSLNFCVGECTTTISP